jgi:AMMECR1 domain-containing protein
MGLTDVLFGRKRLKKAAGERLFALSTAQVTLETELGLKSAGVAAACFKPLSAGEFVRAENELQALLEKVAADSGSRVERKSDDLGFEWLIVRDPDLEDLVTTVHLIGSDLQDRGFGDRLLAAVFRFEGGKNPVYLVYGYKRGAFWPFVPTGEDKKRDNAEELELKAKLEGELPIEQDLSAWFGLFDAPI